MSRACLGEVVAALVDGELDHAARERAHRHLAHCATCREEVDAHRRLKARLTGLSVDPPAPPDALAGRLLGLRPPGAGPAGPPVPPVPARPVSLRPPSGPRGAGPGRRPARRRTALGGAVVALGVVALALGGPQAAPTTPVDPGTDSFLVQHVQTTSDGPRAVHASLTGGGAGSRR